MDVKNSLNYRYKDIQYYNSESSNKYDYANEGIGLIVWYFNKMSS